MDSVRWSYLFSPSPHPTPIPPLPSPYPVVRSHLGSNRLIARTPLRQQCISDASSSIHRRTPASSIPLPAAAFPCQQCIHRRTCATTHSLARCRTFDGADADAGLSARAMARWHDYVLHPQWLGLLAAAAGGEPHLWATTSSYNAVAASTRPDWLLATPVRPLSWRARRVARCPAPHVTGMEFGSGIGVIGPTKTKPS